MTTKSSKSASSKSDTSTESNYRREGKVYALKSSATRAAREDGLVDGQFTVEEVPGDKGRTDYRYKVTEAHKSVAAQMCDDMTPEEKTQLLAEKDPESAHTHNCVGDDCSVASCKCACHDHVDPEPVPVVARDTYDSKGHMVSTTVAPAQVDDEPKKVLKVFDTTTEEGKVALADENPEPVPTPSTTAPKAPKAPKARRQAGTVATKVPSWAVDRHVSTIENPVAVAWALADEMTESNKGVPPRRRDFIQEAEKRGLAYGTARTQYQSWFTARRESEANAAKANAAKK